MLLKAGFKAMEPRGQPAFILYVQTFGDLVTFNPHIHVLVADGVFLPSGMIRVFVSFPLSLEDRSLPESAARYPASAASTFSASRTQ